jgi:hypothetical protein
MVTALAPLGEQLAASKDLPEEADKVAEAPQGAPPPREWTVKK